MENWKQLQLTDEDLDDNLTKEASWAYSENQWYKDNLSAGSIKTAMINKAQYDFRNYMYEDDDYQVACLTKLDEKNNLQVYGLYVGRYANMPGLVNLVHTKLIELLKSYNRTVLYAVWSQSNFVKGDAVFGGLTSESSLLSCGYASGFTKEYAEGQNITYAILI